MRRPAADVLGDAGVHRLDDAGGAAHVADLGRALHGALPVDEAGGVGKRAFGRCALQRGEGGGGEPVVVHLDAGAEPVEAARGELAGEVVHRVALGRLHVVVGVADDVGVGEPGGALGAGGVLAAAEPDRVAGRRHDDGLVDVERPAVVAGQPVHVRGVADDQELDALRLHRGAGAGEAVGVLGGGEAGVGFGTGFLGVRPGAGVLQHAGEAHRDMGAADVADRVPVADLGGGEHLLHLAAEGAELGGEAELGHHLQDDAGDLDVEPLADLAQRPVAVIALISCTKAMLRRRKARASPSAQRVALGDHLADAVEIGGGARDRVELAEQRRELHAQAVDLGELLDVDVGDDGADAMHRADQPLGLEPGQHPAHRRPADRELLASSSSESRAPGG